MSHEVQLCAEQESRGRDLCLLQGYSTQVLAALWQQAPDRQAKPHPCEARSRFFLGIVEAEKNFVGNGDEVIIGRRRVLG